eukprot:TRINITY_DN1414_c0_g1_i1.p1 TRINITY_DN1414_c0_g1~~TRINITY_DN1414_c0_g1_i1.p1  ORF type:complete len:642 (+),score=162.30 TRINITY_DN1414_c0_g1_i1:413-2338(+)
MYYKNTKEVGQLVVTSAVATQRFPNDSKHVNILLNEAMMIITNMTYFNQFIIDALNLPSVSLKLNGLASAVVDCNIGLLNLPNIPFFSSFNIQGMNKFPDVQILSFELPSDGTDNDIISILSTNLINPSPISVLGMGNLTFDIIYENVSLGKGYVSNVSLLSNPYGNQSNILNITGLIKPSKEDLPIAAKLFSNYLRGESNSVTVVGVNTTQSLLLPIISNVVIYADVPGSTNTNLFQSVDPDRMKFDFESNPQNPIISAVISAYYNFPFGFSYTLNQANMSIMFVYEGIPDAVIDVPFIPVTSSGPNEVNLEFSNVPMIVTNQSSLSSFLGELFQTVYTPITLQATAAVNISLDFGEIILYDIPVQQVLNLTGLNGFRTYPINITSAQVIGGQPGMVTLLLYLNLYNPSIAIIYMGKLSLEVYFEGAYIGIGTIRDVHLAVGSNEFEVIANAYQTVDNGPSLETFLSNYICGITSNITLKGYQNSSTVPLLIPGLSTLVTGARVPGMPTGLISFVDMTFDLFKILQFLLPVNLHIYNPFDTNVVITYAVFDMYYNGTGENGYIHVGHIDTPLNIVVLGNQTTISPTIDATITGLSVQLLESLLGSLLVNANGTLTAEIGSGFVSNVYYFQNNVPARFTKV